jgi:hypothetical protein
MVVVDLKQAKRAKRASRDLVPIDKTSRAGRFFERLIREIENDLGGRRNLSRIESELIRAFAGAATTLQYLNCQVALGESSEIDLTGYNRRQHHVAHRLAAWVRAAAAGYHI